MSGWYKMHRGWMNDPLFRNEKFDRARAWEYLIHEAAYEDHDQWFNGESFTVTRGSMIVSERQLAVAWRWDRQRVRTFLGQLEADGKVTREVTQGSTQRVTQLTIRNYERFQGNAPAHKPTNQPTNKPTTEEPSSKGKKNKETTREVFVLQDWVDAGAWADWEEYRRSIKKPLTNKSRQLSVGVLKESLAAGFSVRETIDTAIMNGWRGLFVPKGKPSASKQMVAQSGDPLAGLTFTAAKQQLIDLENAVEMMTLSLTGERDAYWEKYMARNNEAKAFRAAFEAKWPPRSNGVA